MNELNPNIANPPAPEPVVTPDDYLPVVTRLPEALAEEQAERDAAALDARVAQLIDEGQEPAEAERIARGLPEPEPEADDATAPRNVEETVADDAAPAEADDA